MFGQSPPPLVLELELEELELELELLLDDELLLDEPVFVQLLDGCGLLPVTTRVSMLARPLPLVACNRMMLVPALRLTVTLAEFCQVVQEPVPLNATFATCALPFTITCPVRFVVEPLAKRHCKV